MALERALGLALLLASCAPSVPPVVPGRSLPGSDAREHSLIDAGAKLTVIEFFSAHCPCEASHDDPLRTLAVRYSAMNVTFLAVDSETGASVQRDRVEAIRRRFAFPILSDPHGAVARAVGAPYATYTVIIDRGGHVQYRGGIDSNMTSRSEEATPYLRDALDDLLARRPVRRSRTEALGCALRLE